MNLLKIVLYSVSKKGFFDLLYNISCDAREYVGCTNVKKYFDIERVEREELVEIGGGVWISRPVSVGGELRNGECFHASISHNGVVAIHSYGPSFKPEGETEYKHIIQFTDLSSTRQVEMEVEASSLVGFYDNSMILLTWYQPLREASVESVFANPTLGVFKRVGSVDYVSDDTDVSLLHNTRVLYYYDTDCAPFVYNVDTHINTRLDIGKSVLTFASMTGIDVGVKGMFEEIGGDYCTFTLNKDNSTTKIEEKQIWRLRNFLPSSTCPSDIERGVLKYNGHFIFNKRKIFPRTPIKFEEYQSLVRIYKDIFLAYDENTKQWVLIKILIP